MTTTRTIADAARDYLSRGFQPTPIAAGEKRPILDAWQKTILAADQIDGAFAPGLNVGLMLGDPSGGLVDVDLDCDEARELADQYLPPTDAITGRPSAPRSHRWYIAPGATTRRHQMPAPSREAICELRSTGAQTLVGPSIHPTGERYDDLSGAPASVPAPMLAACVEALARAVAKARGVTDTPETTAPARVIVRRDHDRQHLLERAGRYLDAMPPAISGAGGHNATFAAASAMVHGFGLPDTDALSLLEYRYNPRCDPPWTRRELEHKVRQAGTVKHAQPYRYLADAESPPESNGVDLSAFEFDAPAPKRMEPFPEHLLNVPGFVGDVIAHNLATAARPQPVLALGAALCLQGVLAGRKVEDCYRRTRTNILAIGVARSGAGKDHARQINKDILAAAGGDALLGTEDPASDAGLYDHLVEHPARLLQIDEFGRFLEAAVDPRRAPHLHKAVTTLMKLYSSASSHMTGKAYAQRQPQVLIQPHAVLWGTTVPESLTNAAGGSDLIEGGFFGRLLIFESDEKPEMTEAVYQPIPKPILDAARWWWEYNPGTLLNTAHPRPHVVSYDDAARECRRDFGKWADGQGGRGGAREALWSRAVEKASQLALIYAVSRDRHSPVVDRAAFDWASELVSFLTRRMLELIGEHVAENEFDKNQLKILRALGDHAARKNPWMSLTALTACTRGLKPRDRRDMLENLQAGGYITHRMRETKTKPVTEYRLLNWGGASAIVT